MKQKHFTKWLLGLVTFVAVTILAACGSGKENAHYFQKINQTAKSDIRMTYYYKGDTVTRQTTENELPYSYFGTSDKEAAKAILEPSSKQYQNIKGVKESITYGENSIKEKLEIDYEVVNFKELAKVDKTFASTNTGKNTKVSMKASAKLLENNNFKEVKDGKFESLK